MPKIKNVNKMNIYKRPEYNNKISINSSLHVHVVSEIQIIQSSDWLK